MKRDKVLIPIIFIVILLIPIIYSFFYLKSYWDPYGNLSGIKIAVVNLDKGENNENQGSEFIQGLKDSNTFDIYEVTLDDANEGMQNGDYYATIIVPENFTKCLNSISDKDKQIATITYSPNQASNYLATQIINSAVKTMEINLQAKINSKIVGCLSDKLNEVPEKMMDVSNGIEQILDGTHELSSGTKELKEGTVTLSTSNGDFNSAIHKLKKGTEKIDANYYKIDTGIASAKTGAETLSKGTTQLSDGAEELNKGITKASKNITISLNKSAKTLDTGIETVQENVNIALVGKNNSVNYIIESANESLKTGLSTAMKENLASYVDQTAKKQVEATLDVVLEDPSLGLTDKQKVAIKKSATSQIDTSATIKKVVPNIVSTAIDKSVTGQEKNVKKVASQIDSGFNTLRKEVSNNMDTGVKKIQEGMDELETGSKTLQTSIDEKLVPGAKTLSTGINKLNTGSQNIQKGINTLDLSTKEITNASDKLLEGSQALETGMTKLVSGVGTLSNGANTFKTEVDNSIVENKEELSKIEELDEFAENPVKFVTEAYGEVNSYGIAFTPLFLCIGLWVGALMGYVVLYYDQKNRFKILGSNYKNKFIQNIAYIGIGAIQGIITAVLLKLGLGFEIQNISLYYMASILIGITFTSIIQCLIRNFGDIGKFLALIILVLQLAASGGTFPIETINKVFQAITPYLPMTYSIKLLREILIPTATNFKGQCIGILIGITVVTIFITYIVDIIRNRVYKSNYEEMKKA